MNSAWEDFKKEEFASGLLREDSAEEAMHKLGSLDQDGTAPGVGRNSPQALGIVWFFVVCIQGNNKVWGLKSFWFLRPTLKIFFYLDYLTIHLKFLACCLIALLIALILIIKVKTIEDTEHVQVYFKMFMENRIER